MTEKSKATSLSKDDISGLKSLPTGAVVDIQITTPTAPRRIKTTYVGMELGQCMIFQISTSAKWMSVRDLLTVGNELVVRFVLEGEAGQVIAFRVKVLKLLTKPSGLLITSFPRRIESKGLRANKRAYPGISVRVKSDEFGDTGASGIIVDISADGCKIALPIKPEWPVLHDSSPLTLLYGSEQDESQIATIVKNHRLEPNFVYYGVKFDGEEEAINTLLSNHTLIN